MAKTIGLRHEANFAKKAGSCETSGVTRALFPKQANMTITAYGDQIPAHRQTLVMATLAIRTSALSAVAS
jgi:hypothetical protein